MHAGPTCSPLPIELVAIGPYVAAGPMRPAVVPQALVDVPISIHLKHSVQRAMA